jgi:mRNA interferase MazF
VIPGELYWVTFPPSDGHEQAGRRPALVLQDDVYGAPLSAVFVVPVTGSPANARFPATVRVDPTQENGPYAPSVVLVFQARGMDRKRFGNRIGVITPAKLVEIHTALDRLLGRP